MILIPIVITLTAGQALRAAQADRPATQPDVVRTVVNTLPERTNFKALTYRDKIYAFKYGPDHDIATPEDYLKGGSVYVYDTSSGKWQARAKMPVSKATYSLVAVNNKFYVIGGFTAKDTPSNSVEEYDPAIDTWTTKRNMPTARCRIGIGLMRSQIESRSDKITSSDSRPLSL